MLVSADILLLLLQSPDHVIRSRTLVQAPLAGLTGLTGSVYSFVSGISHFYRLSFSTYVPLPDRPTFVTVAYGAGRRRCQIALPFAFSSGHRKQLHRIGSLSPLVGSLRSFSFSLWTLNEHGTYD